MSELLANAPLHFPKARDWMWNYCIYLGPYTSETGTIYDLGVYLGSKFGDSAAIVFGNTDGDYMSGPIDHKGNDVYVETLKRAKALNLI